MYTLTHVMRHDKETCMWPRMYICKIRKEHVGYKGHGNGCMNGVLETICRKQKNTGTKTCSASTLVAYGNRGDHEFKVWQKSTKQNNNSPSKTTSHRVLGGIN